MRWDGKKEVGWGGSFTDKRIIPVTGHGSFLFCAQESETAVRV